jgi:hypothetical protein
VPAHARTRRGIDDVARQRDIERAPAGAGGHILDERHRHNADAVNLADVVAVLASAHERLEEQDGKIAGRRRISCCLRVRR